MIDTYLKSMNEAELLALQTSLKNIVKPRKGSVATEETIDEEGAVQPAQPAKGDPNYYYTCVRASFPIPAFDGVEVCSAEEGYAVVGGWG